MREYFSFFLGINIFLFDMFKLKAITKDDFKSFQSDIGLDIIPSIHVQLLEKYIEQWRAEVWETCFYREFNGQIKPIGVQKSQEWVKQYKYLQVLKWVMFRCIYFII
jgi:hypothetical protein